jgi:hypothetical protein
MSDTTNFGFIIKEISADTNSVVVWPYSPLFKKPANQYLPINVALTNLSPDIDYNTQIAATCKPIIDSILLQESENYVINIVRALSGSINTITTVPVTSVSMFQVSLSGATLYTSDPPRTEEYNKLNFFAAVSTQVLQTSGIQLDYNTFDFVGAGYYTLSALPSTPTIAPINFVA